MNPDEIQNSPAFPNLDNPIVDDNAPDQPTPLKQPFWRRLLQNKKIIIFLAVVVSWVILLLVYSYFTRQAEPLIEETPAPSPTPSGAPVQTSDLNDPSTWVEYKGDDYSFNYPSQADVEYTPYLDATRISYGENVIENSEFETGFSVMTYEISYRGGNILDIAKEYYEYAKEDPLMLNISTINETDVSGKQAIVFSYNVSSGEIKEYFFDKNNYILRVSVFASYEGSVNYNELTSLIVQSLNY